MSASDWSRGDARAWSLAGGPLDLGLTPAPPPPDDETERRIEEVWAAQRAQWPRLFDGPILAISSWSPSSRTLRAHRSSYRPFAVGLGGGPTDSWLLAITGLITARLPDGRQAILLGKRGRATWLYLDMWELGPSGGVPPRDDGTLTMDDLAAQTFAELEEEAGIDARGAAARPVAVATDPGARSLDVIMRIDLAVEPAAVAGAVHAHGEYSETLWLPVDEVEAFVRERRAAIIPPTIATLRALGLLAGGEVESGR